MFRLDAQDIRHGETIHEAPRFFRWHWMAVVAANWYVAWHSWGQATVSEPAVKALTASQGTPYRTEICAMHGCDEVVVEADACETHRLWRKLVLASQGHVEC